MKIIKINQNGLTLVEVLAVLVLVSLVTGIIWTTISLSFKHTEVETTKLQLQQEANLVITKLQEEHRKQDCYQILLASNKITLQSCEGSILLFSHVSEQFNYGPFLSETIRTKEEDLNLSNFYVESVQDHKKVTIPTIISRYKSEK